MGLVKCRCGRYTSNGLVCTFCTPSFSFDGKPPSDEEEEFETEGYSIIDPNEEDDELD